jgi:hypothetical protein
MIDGMPDRALREVKARSDLCDRRIGIDQGLEFTSQGDMCHRSILGSMIRKSVERFSERIMRE